MAENIPEYYIDGFGLRALPFGVTLVLSKTMAPLPDEPKEKPVVEATSAIEFAEQMVGTESLDGRPQCVIRMSIVEAKLLAMALRNRIKLNELENFGGDLVPVPPGALKAAKLTLDDW